MITPYDWQEAVRNRASYIEGRLRGGLPVLAATLKDEILLLSARRQSYKIYEVYDQLAIGLVGQQSDAEMLRTSAIDFAHQEGFQRSEHDVTIQRVVNSLSQPLKRAFGDFNTAPFIIRALFCEVGPKPESDQYFVLDYDGDYSLRKGFAFVVGDDDAGVKIRDVVGETDFTKLNRTQAITLLKKAWAAGVDPTGESTFEKLTQNLTTEIAVLRRAETDSSFARLEDSKG